MSRRVLITGGAGFIGSHLAEALLARGDEVVALDNLVTGSLDNLATFADHTQFTFVEGSVLDRELVEELAEPSDAIIHLAAAVGVQLVLQKPLDSFLVNIDGTHIVLDAAHRFDRTLIVASTSEVYGKNTDVPLGEDSDRVLGPLDVTRWWYSISKGVDEILALGYHHERGTKAIVARFFNTVGPRQTGRYGMVIPRLVGQARANQALTVYGTGKQTRSFCHVLDTVRALLLLLDEPAAVGHAFNIGSDREISIDDLAKRIIELAGSSSQLEYIPYEVAYPAGFEDTDRRVANTGRLFELVGWQAERSLDDIVLDVLAETPVTELGSNAR